MFDPPKYKNLKEVKAAFDSGELKTGRDKLSVTNETVFITLYEGYKWENDIKEWVGFNPVRVFEQPEYQTITEAISLCGLPWEHM